MKIYISGKIGEEVLSETTRQKFVRAEELLKAKGYEVFNPTTSGLGKRAEELVLEADYKTSFYQEILLIDLAQLAQCDAIFLLADWHESPGANVEAEFAAATGKDFFCESKADAMHFCHEKHYFDIWLPIK